MERNLPEKTGRSMDEWLDVLRASGIEGLRPRQAWLKEEHGLGHYQAEMIARRLTEGVPRGATSDDDLVDAQYAGKRAHLRPIHEAITAHITSQHPDAELGVRKTYVNFSVGNVYGHSVPATNSRLDLKLLFREGLPSSADERLQPIDKAGEPMSHKVALTSLEDLDDTVLGWISAAHEERARADA